MNGLALDGVTVRRGAGAVISDITLHVEAGQVMAIVGPNGAGKTSLIEAISGMLPVSAGSVSMDGVDVTHARAGARFRRGLVHVEQGRAVFPSLTVWENIRLTASGPAAIDEALARFPELEKRRSSPAGLLSGGEQQMVVLARSIAAQPKILLLDEMSLGLAPVVFARLLPLVGELASSGVAVLMVEQFTSAALAVSDEALVVASGRVGYQGAAAALRDDPELLQRAYMGDDAVRR